MPKTIHIMPDFGEQFARIRGARGLSQEKLAQLSGISRTTIARAETADKCPINGATMMAILRALATANPPLDAQEASWLAAEAGVDRAAALSYVPDPQDLQSLDAVSGLVSELHTYVGAEQLRDLLTSLLNVVKASRIPATSAPRARSLVIKSPPVQREGFVEQTEVVYTPREPGTAPPGSAAAGF